MEGTTTKNALRRALLALACVGTLTLTACDPGGGDSGDPSRATGGQAVPGPQEGMDGQEGDPESLTVQTSAPSEEALVLPGSSAQDLSGGAAQALFASSPVVVLASEDESLRAASAAVALGVPVVLDGEGAADELQRLGARTALVIGSVDDPGIDVVAPTSDEELARILGIQAPPEPVEDAGAVAALTTLTPDAPKLLVPADSPQDQAGQDDAAATSAPATLQSDLDSLPTVTRGETLASVLVLSTGKQRDLAAVGTARAAGAAVVLDPDRDPRSPASMQAIADQQPASVVALGSGDGDSEALAWKMRSAATGTELPGGGQLVLPGKTYVALYGTPGSGALGVLGEQDPEATIARAEEHAQAYAELTDTTVVPTLEIIVTIASAQAGADNDYSSEVAIETIEPLVDLAEEHGLYVVLDLQPGRTDFLTQAKMYEELLTRPHVGLALDPEWRLRPDEVHLTQIGHVGIDEVNEVVSWLADLTREHDLPQKVLVLHMFQNRMIPDVDQVDQSRDEVEVLIHVDGQGAQPDKQATWRTLQHYAPSVKNWGWKNFYDEDTPMLSAEETMAQVDPPPDFISYQ